MRHQLRLPYLLDYTISFKGQCRKFLDSRKNCLNYITARK